MVSPVQLRSNVKAVHDQVHAVDVVACLAANKALELADPIP